MTTPEDPAGTQPGQPRQPDVVPPWQSSPAGPPPLRQSDWGTPPTENTGDWTRPRWTPDEPLRQSHARRNGCLLGCGAGLVAVIAIVAFLAFSAAQLLGPAADVSKTIQQNSGGLVNSATYKWTNGVGEFDIWLAPAAQDAQKARDVACTVVRPALKGTRFEGTNFRILDSRGQIVADETTSCG